MDHDFTVPADWYRSFFTAPVNQFWESMVPEAATVADLAFLRRHLPPPPARILDAPCGAGRHALALARAGYSVAGIDLSAEAIARAGAAAADEEGLAVKFRQQDMRGFEAAETFDAALCLGNSLAYFPPPEMAAFVARLAEAVRTGGRLVLDTYCCAESIFPLAEERDIAFDGGTYRSRFCYDSAASVLKTNAQLTLAGEVHELLYAHHVVTSGELVRTVEAAGVRVDSLYSDTDGAPFAPGSPRLLLVGTRTQILSR
jgi:SAM-dependent methyltransferase